MRIDIVEVAPRDGLQNEQRVLPTEAKLELIERAARTGVRRIEVTSFVRPDRVPQLADAAEVASALADHGIGYSALVLNLRGYERALAAGIREVTTLVLASDTFSRRNQGMTTQEAVEVVREIRRRGRADGVQVAVTIGASFGCPFEGEVPEPRFRGVAAAVADLDADEVSLADTIGVAVPSDIETRFGILRELAPAVPMRVHLHDTRNTGVANAVAAVRSGVRALDASLGGIGGCPFAPGASGNVATEDVVYTLHRMGFDTGLDLGAAIEHAGWVTGQLGVPVSGRLARVGGFPR
ncbi:hydroxymethylglutaryl-CoA lyase [Amycolatopsis thermophila]|uniref:Hydroxymethylglutaryl-CoA lyase n=1 Tax=Amycolatopsis thermophila TaxID=206084 RepID=A0ABU0F0S8_9PSEU|nr:hydroxymethylglutaryl-CoA lyase [Amycolatopsis thermophila]MDQ0381103.1 hydroxymethylglutaryl-CoA lyase [Amycolatopsis thermophila]